MEKLQISYANGTIIQNLLAFLDFWKFLKIVLLRTVILQKEVVACP